MFPPPKTSSFFTQLYLFLAFLYKALSHLPNSHSNSISQFSLDGFLLTPLSPQVISTLSTLGIFSSLSHNSFFYSQLRPPPSLSLALFLKLSIFQLVSLSCLFQDFFLAQTVFLSVFSCFPSNNPSSSKNTRPL